jgi:hypothetical protein
MNPLREVPPMIYPVLTIPQAEALKKRMSIEIRDPGMTEDEHFLFVAALGAIGAAQPMSEPPERDV